MDVRAGSDRQVALENPAGLSFPRANVTLEPRAAPLGVALKVCMSHLK